MTGLIIKRITRTAAEVNFPHRETETVPDVGGASRGRAGAVGELDAHKLRLHWGSGQLHGLIPSATGECRGREALPPATVVNRVDRVPRAHPALDLEVRRVGGAPGDP